MITTTLKTVNYYYLTKYVQGKAMSTEDSMVLEPIALVTPYIGGDAVFGARVMLGIDPDDYGLAYKGELDMGNEITEDYRIYPNPASDVLNIELLDQTFTPESKIVLLDLTGRVMLQTTSQGNARNASLHLDALTNGVYILQVLNGNERLITERVILNK
jgi:hypothetical protein